MYLSLLNFCNSLCTQLLLHKLHTVNKYKTRTENSRFSFDWMLLLNNNGMPTIIIELWWGGTCCRRKNLWTFWKELEIRYQLKLKYIWKQLWIRMYGHAWHKYFLRCVYDYGCDISACITLLGLTINRGRMDYLMIE